MRRVPVAATIRDAYIFTAAHLGGIIGLIWVPMVIVTVAQFFTFHRYYNDFIEAMAGGLRCGGRRLLSVSWECLVAVLDTVQFVPVEVRNVRVQFDVYREQSVLMDIFANRLRERAAQLGISNAEAARRSGLDERRYAHYVTGRREPDLETLVRIARALGTSPSWLLGEPSVESSRGGRVYLR